MPIRGGEVGIRPLQATNNCNLGQLLNNFFAHSHHCSLCYYDTHTHVSAPILWIYPRGGVNATLQCRGGAWVDHSKTRQYHFYWGSSFRKSVEIASSEAQDNQSEANLSPDTSARGEGSMVSVCGRWGSDLPPPKAHKYGNINDSHALSMFHTPLNYLLQNN